MNRSSPGAYEVISLFRSQIETLQSKVYFLRDGLKEKNNMIKSLTAPYTFNIHSIYIFNIQYIHCFSVFDSSDCHVNKLTSEDDMSDSKSHVLIPFPYSDKDLPTKAAVSATITTTTTAQIIRIEATAQ